MVQHDLEKQAEIILEALRATGNESTCKSGKRILATSLIAFSANLLRVSHIPISTGLEQLFEDLEHTSEVLKTILTLSPAFKELKALYETPTLASSSIRYVSFLRVVTPIYLLLVPVTICFILFKAYRMPAINLIGLHAFSIACR